MGMAEGRVVAALRRDGTTVDVHLTLSDESKPAAAGRTGRAYVGRIRELREGLVDGRFWRISVSRATGVVMEAEENGSTTFGVEPAGVMYKPLQTIIMSAQGSRRTADDVVKFLLESAEAQHGSGHAAGGGFGGGGGKGGSLRKGSSGAAGDACQRCRVIADSGNLVDARIEAVHEDASSDRAAESSHLVTLHVWVADRLDGVVAISTEGIIVDSNQGAQLLFGYSAAELLGCNVSVLMPAAVAAHHDGFVRRAATQAAQRVIGLRRVVDALHRDGSPLRVMLELSESGINYGKEAAFVARMRHTAEPPSPVPPEVAATAAATAASHGAPLSQQEEAAAAAQRAHASRFGGSFTAAATAAAAAAASPRHHMRSTAETTGGAAAVPVTEAFAGGSSGGCPFASSAAAQHPPPLPPRPHATASGGCVMLLPSAAEAPTAAPTAAAAASACPFHHLLNPSRPAATATTTGPGPVVESAASADNGDEPGGGAGANNNGPGGGGRDREKSLAARSEAATALHGGGEDQIEGQEDDAAMQELLAAVRRYKLALQQVASPKMMTAVRQIRQAFPLIVALSTTVFVASIVATAMLFQKHDAALTRVDRAGELTGAIATLAVFVQVQRAAILGLDLYIPRQSLASAQEKITATVETIDQYAHGIYKGFSSGETVGETIVRAYEAPALELKRWVQASDDVTGFYSVQNSSLWDALRAIAQAGRSLQDFDNASMAPAHISYYLMVRLRISSVPNLFIFGSEPILTDICPPRLWTTARTLCSGSSCGYRRSRRRRPGRSSPR